MRRTLATLIAASTMLLVVSAPALASGPPLGYYQCYVTTQDYNALSNKPSGFSTTFAGAFWLRPNNKYEVSFLIGNNTFGQRYSVKGSSVHFGKGAFNDDMSFVHLTGTYHPHGVTMPHSVFKPTLHYKLVLRGRSADRDTAPPASEFTGSVARSFWYCNRR